MSGLAMDNLTKHERRMAKIQAKKEQRQEQLSGNEQKQNAKKIIVPALIIIAAIVLAFIAFNWYNSFGDGPSIQVTPDGYNFGQVSQASGTASASLSLKNKGKSDLVITNMVSSCGCTSAVLVVDGVESPVFGMHSNYPNWSQELVPGQEAELRVKYDPNVHKDLKGAVTRTLTIHSNDPLNSLKELTIKAYQVE